MAEVFKLQKPFHSTEAQPKILVYNRDKSLQFFMDLSPIDVYRVFGANDKVYCLCTLNGSELEIGDEVTHPGW